MGDAEAAHRLHSAEEVVEHVTPVAEHIRENAAALRLAVVPARPLGLLPGAFEHPIAELAAHREDAAEEAGIDEGAQFSQARQIELVLDDAGLDATSRGELRRLQRRCEAVGDRLLAIDMLAGADRLL